MKRRNALSIVVCAFAAGPQFAAAQCIRLPRVVMIVSGDGQGGSSFIESFREGLRESGHVEGQTLVLEIRYGRLDPTRTATLLRETVAEQPDVLVVTGLSAAREARDLTSTIPVIVATSSDLIHHSEKRSAIGCVETRDRQTELRSRRLDAPLDLRRRRKIRVGGQAFPRACRGL